jgi:tetraacyldisaccharide 4'-kinase
MRPPAFWQHDGVLPRLLSPIAGIVAASTARRVARPGWRAPVPVVCCGNVTLGGAGKTTLALDLGARLLRRGRAVHFIIRGYGGRVRGPLRVDPAQHGAALVGDEALLLAAIAPTWVGSDRAASARAAVRDGAAVLVMDDGLQNPGLAQDMALLVIDGAAGFGNGRVAPAGPLREPVAAGAGRCHAAVLIGHDDTEALASLPASLTLLRASLHADASGLTGRRVVAFAGIGRPSKFFATLAQAGADIVGQAGFPDHHRYGARDLDGVFRQAAKLGAEVWTTPKDAVRLPAGVLAQVNVAGVRLAWDDELAIEGLLGTLA